MNSLCTSARCKRGTLSSACRHCTPYAHNPRRLQVHKTLCHIHSARARKLPHSLRRHCRCNQSTFQPCNGCTKVARTWCTTLYSCNRRIRSGHSPRRARLKGKQVHRKPPCCTSRKCNCSRPCRHSASKCHTDALRPDHARRKSSMPPGSMGTFGQSRSCRTRRPHKSHSNERQHTHLCRTTIRSIYRRNQHRGMHYSTPFRTGRTAKWLYTCRTTASGTNRTLQRLGIDCNNQQGTSRNHPRRGNRNRCCLRTANIV